MRFTFVFLFVLVLQNISAQQNLPVIRANSKYVKINDGLNYKPDYWVIFPKIKPDIYYLDLPRKKTLLKFITDVDSIYFNLNYGEVKDFVVLLNGKDSCYTRISASYPNLKTPKKGFKENDTIPFILKDNRIYFKGKINGSEVLNIQFDLGAEAVNLNKKSVKKIKISFDRKGNLINSDGINETRVGSNNEIEIAGLKWSGIEIYETKNMENHEDAIIGNSFFLDQIYKIDYDKRILILYEKLPQIEASFVKQNMILDNGIRPLIEGGFIFDDVVFKDWFLFDTGNSGNGIIGNSYLIKYNLNDKFSTIIGFRNKKVVYIPKLNIANRTIVGGTLLLEKQNKKGSEYKYGGLFGNKLLQRFNVIIDNQEGFTYLKPNLFWRKEISN
jgi:hypothetical protein